MLTSCYLRTIPHRLADHSVYEVLRMKGGWICTTCADRKMHRDLIRRYPNIKFIEDGQEVSYDKSGRKQR